MSARDAERARAQQARAISNGTPEPKGLFAPPFRPSNDKSSGIKQVLEEYFDPFDKAIDPNRYVGIGDVPGTPQPKNGRSVGNSDPSTPSSSQSSSLWGGNSSPLVFKPLPPSSSPPPSSATGGGRAGVDRPGRDHGGRSDARGSGYSSGSHDGGDSSAPKRGRSRKDDKYHNKTDSSGSYDRQGTDPRHDTSRRHHQSSHQSSSGTSSSRSGRDSRGGPVAPTASARASKPEPLMLNAAEAIPRSTYKIPRTNNDSKLSSTDETKQRRQPQQQQQQQQHPRIPSGGRSSSDVAPSLDSAVAPPSSSSSNRPVNSPQIMSPPPVGDITDIKRMVQEMVTLPSPVTPIKFGPRCSPFLLSSPTRQQQQQQTSTGAAAVPGSGDTLSDDFGDLSDDDDDDDDDHHGRTSTDVPVVASASNNQDVILNHVDIFGPESDDDDDDDRGDGEQTTSVPVHQAAEQKKLSNGLKTIFPNQPVDNPSSSSSSSEDESDDEDVMMEDSPTASPNSHSQTDSNHAEVEAATHSRDNDQQQLLHHQQQSQQQYQQPASAAPTPANKWALSSLCPDLAQTYKPNAVLPSMETEKAPMATCESSIPLEQQFDDRPVSVETGVKLDSNLIPFDGGYSSAVIKTSPQIADETPIDGAVAADHKPISSSSVKQESFLHETVSKEKRPISSEFSGDSEDDSDGDIDDKSDSLVKNSKKLANVVITDRSSSPSAKLESTSSRGQRQKSAPLKIESAGQAPMPALDKDPAVKDRKRKGKGDLNGTSSSSKESAMVNNVASSARDNASKKRKDDSGRRLPVDVNELPAPRDVKPSPGRLLEEANMINMSAFDPMDNDIDMEPPMYPKLDGVFYDRSGFPSIIVKWSLLMLNGKENTVPQPVDDYDTDKESILIKNAVDTPVKKERIRNSSASSSSSGSGSSSDDGSSASSDEDEGEESDSGKTMKSAANAAATASHRQRQPTPSPCPQPPSVDNAYSPSTPLTETPPPQSQVSSVTTTTATPDATTSSLGQCPPYSNSPSKHQKSSTPPSSSLSKPLTPLGGDSLHFAKSPRGRKAIPKANDIHANDDVEDCQKSSLSSSHHSSQPHISRPSSSGQNKRRLNDKSSPSQSSSKDVEDGRDLKARNDYDRNSSASSSSSSSSSSKVSKSPVRKSLIDGVVGGVEATVMNMDEENLYSQHNPYLAKRAKLAGASDTGDGEGKVPSSSKAASASLNDTLSSSSSKSASGKKCWPPEDSPSAPEVSSSTGNGADYPPVSHPMPFSSDQQQQLIQSQSAGVMMSSTSSSSSSACHPAHDSLMDVSSVGGIEASKSRPPEVGQQSSSVTSSAQISIPVHPFMQQQRLSADGYLKQAKSLKHSADKVVDKTKKYMTYLECVLGFAQCAYEMENEGNRQQEDICKMYEDTIKMLKFVFSKYKQNDPSDCDKKIFVLNMRIQALLYQKLFKFKRSDASRLSKHLASDQYAKPPSGAAVIGGKFVGNSPSAGSAASPYQANLSATTASGAPSPAGSGHGAVAVATAGAAAGLLSTPDTVAVPVKIHTYNQRYKAVMDLVLNSHDLWDQADNLANQLKDFFSVVESKCGSIHLSCTIVDLARYVKESLKLLGHDHPLLNSQS